MKKNFLLSAILMAGASLSANSQMLATFEDDGANDKCTIGCNWYDSSRYLQEPGIMTNTHTNGLNTSGNAGGCISAAPITNGWWGRFTGLVMKEGEEVVITESNRYLKMLMYKGEQTHETRIYWGDVCDGGDDIWQGNLSKTGEWVGIVVDLGAKHMGETLTKITMCIDCSWDETPTTTNFEFMFDDIQLSDGPLPIGVTPVSDLSGFELGFEKSYDSWVNEFTGYMDENVLTVVDNPYKTSVNSTDKVMEFQKSENASWWQGCGMTFKNTLELGTDYTYAHAFIRVPSEALDGRESVDVQVCAKDFLGNENTLLQGIWDDEVDEWIDIVMPITQISYLDELVYRFDVRKDDNGDYVNSPANTFYVDGITLNNDPEPRTTLNPSGVNDAVANNDNIAIIGETGAIAVKANDATVNIYDLAGALVSTTIVNGSASIAAENGLYLVQVISAEGNKTAKVAVK